MAKTGIIFIAPIIGIPPSLRETLLYFAKQGFAVETVDIFEQEKQRKFWKILGLTVLPRAHGRRVAFANEYDEARLFARVYKAIQRLQEQGCDRFVLGGMSGGFIFASRIAQTPMDDELNKDQWLPIQSAIAGVFGISPLLFYPLGVERLVSRLDRIPGHIPAVLIWGEDDDIIPPSTTVYGFSLAQAHPHIIIRILRKSDFPNHRKDIRHQFFGGKDFIGPLANRFWHPEAEQVALDLIMQEISILKNKNMKIGD